MIMFNFAWWLRENGSDEIEYLQNIVQGRNIEPNF